MRLFKDCKGICFSLLFEVYWKEIVVWNLYCILEICYLVSKILWKIVFCKDFLKKSRNYFGMEYVCNNLYLISIKFDDKFLIKRKEKFMIWIFKLK